MHVVHCNVAHDTATESNCFCVVAQILIRHFSESDQVTVIITST